VLAMLDLEVRLPGKLDLSLYVIYVTVCITHLYLTKLGYVPSLGSLWLW
jgi:hypothetical protein